MFLYFPLSLASTFLSFIKTLDYVAVSNEELSVPKWQIKEVEKRLKTLEKHPEEAIDFDKTIQNIEKKRRFI